MGYVMTVLLMKRHCGTVGYVSEAAIRKYIEGQKGK